MKLTDTYKGADGLFRTPSDQPIWQLKHESARQAKAAHVPSDVLPKFTCEHCGERNFAGEPNNWPEAVTCSACGHSQPFIKGGFAMRYRINERPDNAHLPPKVIVGLPREMAANQSEADANSQRVCKAFGIDIDHTTPISAEELAEAMNAAKLAADETAVKAEAKANE